MSFAGKSERADSPVGIKAFILGVGVIILQVLGIQAFMDGSGFGELVKNFLMCGFGILLFVQLFSTNYARSTLIFFIFCGLFEGYLKLNANTSSQSVMVYLLRDFLLYAMIMGGLLRYFMESAGQGTSQVKFPPFSGLIFMYMAFCFMQLLHPSSLQSTSTFMNSLAGIRPHIEFLPLYFIGYWIFSQNPKKIQLFYMVFVAIALINAIVTIFQFYIPLDTLVKIFGQGYEKLFNPEIGMNRMFIDTASGTIRLRPPGLGSDAGFAGQLSFIATAMTVGWIGINWERIKRAGPIGWFFYGGILAILFTGAIYSSARSWFLLTFFTMVAVPILRFINRENIVKITLFILLFIFVMDAVGGVLKYTNTPGITRFMNVITLERLATRIKSERLIHYISFNQTLVNAPLGYGLGVTGAASGRFLSQMEQERLRQKNISGEFYYLFVLAEIGVIGLFLVLTMFYMLLTMAGNKLIKTSNPYDRWHGAIILSILSAILVNSFFGGGINQFPQGPIFWMLNGIWLAFPTRRSIESDHEAA